MAEQPFNGVDLMIRPDAEGVYDLVIENGQIRSVNSFDTAFDMIIHCERRANPAEVPTPEFRRGWFGNLIISDTGFEMGSKLWLLHQERRTQDVLNKAVNYVQQACQWLIDDGHLKDVTVSGELIGQGGIGIRIDYITLDNKTEARYWEMWRNTGRYTVLDKVRALPNLRIEYLELAEEQEEVEEGEEWVPIYETKTGGKLLNEDGSLLVMDRRIDKKQL